MKICEIAKLLQATVVCGEDLLDREIFYAYSSDMMSEVLTHATDQSVLLTSLVNPQVVRTAEMMDIVCIVFVSGKKPNNLVIEMAKSKEIIVLITYLHMFVSCGKLYEAGLKQEGCGKYNE